MVWASAIISDRLILDANFEFVKATGGEALVVQLTPRELLNAVFYLDHAGTPTDDVEIQILGGHRVKTALGIDAALAGSIDLNTASDAITVDDALNGTYIVMTSGDEEGEGRLIIDSADANDRVTLSHNLSAVPSATETYDRYNFGIIAELLIRVATPSQTEANTKFYQTAGYEFVAFLARASGSTDAHVLTMSHQIDNVDI